MIKKILMKNIFANCVDFLEYNSDGSLKAKTDIHDDDVLEIQELVWNHLDEKNFIRYMDVVASDLSAEQPKNLIGHNAAQIITDFSKNNQGIEWTRTISFPWPYLIPTSSLRRSEESKKVQYFLDSDFIRRHLFLRNLSNELLAIFVVAEIRQYCYDKRGSSNALVHALESFLHFSGQTVDFLRAYFETENIAIKRYYDFDLDDNFINLIESITDQNASKTLEWLHKLINKILGKRIAMIAKFRQTYYRYTSFPVLDGAPIFGNVIQEVKIPDSELDEALLELENTQDDIANDIALSDEEYEINDAVSKVESHNQDFFDYSPLLKNGDGQLDNSKNNSFQPKWQTHLIRKQALKLWKQKEREELKEFYSNPNYNGFLKVYKGDETMADKIDKKILQEALKQRKKEWIGNYESDAAKNESLSGGKNKKDRHSSQDFFNASPSDGNKTTTIRRPKLILKDEFNSDKLNEIYKEHDGYQRHKEELMNRYLRRRKGLKTVEFEEMQTGKESYDGIPTIEAVTIDNTKELKRPRTASRSDRKVNFNDFALEPKNKKNRKTFESNSRLARSERHGGRARNDNRLEKNRRPGNKKLRLGLGLGIPFGLLAAAGIGAIYPALMYFNSQYVALDNVNEFTIGNNSNAFTEGAEFAKIKIKNYGWIKSKNITITSKSINGFLGKPQNSLSDHLKTTLNGDTIVVNFVNSKPDITPASFFNQGVKFEIAASGAKSDTFSVHVEWHIPDLDAKHGYANITKPNATNIDDDSFIRANANVEASTWNTPGVYTYTIPDIAKTSEESIPIFEFADEMSTLGNWYAIKSTSSDVEAPNINRDTGIVSIDKNAGANNSQQYIFYIQISNFAVRESYDDTANYHFQDVKELFWGKDADPVPFENPGDGVGYLKFVVTFK